MIDYAQIAVDVKQKRKELRITQPELSKLIGVGITSIMQFERRHRIRCYSENLFAYLDFLGKTIDDYKKG